MLQKRDYVRYAGEGGLYLWDNECLVRWDNLSASDRTDWLLFFDVCREEPTAHTEAIITAITNGLCPHKSEAIIDMTPDVWYERASRPKPPSAKFWYLREHAGGFGKDTVPEFVRQPAPYFLGEREKPRAWYEPPTGMETVLVPIAWCYGGRTPRKQFRRRAWKVHKFEHYFDAWRFLFQFI